MNDAIASRRERQLLAEMEALDARWKSASGLARGGDPDGVTPEAAAEYWGAVEAERDGLLEVLHGVRQWVEWAPLPTEGSDKRDRLGDAANSAMHTLLHVDADMTERTEAAEALAGALEHPWPPYPTEGSVREGDADDL